MRRRPLLILVAWAGGLALAGVLLGRASHGGLAPPSLDFRAWEAWAQGRGPVESAFALVLLATRVAAGYLLGATVLSVLASLSGRRWLAGAATRLSVPLLERMVAGALGLVVVGAVAGGPWADGGGRQVAVLVVSAGPAAGGDPPVMHRLEAQPAPAPAPEAEPPPARDWELGAGDHLWSVAEQVLQDAWGRAPSDREVAPYWSRLVDDNRPRLADPANPDLVFPGQVVALPALPPAP